MIPSKNLVENISLKFKQLNVETHDDNKSQ